MMDQLAAGPEFSSDKHWLGTDLGRLVALDQSRRLVCLVDGSTGVPLRRLYPARDLVDVAVVEDGETLTETRTSRGSQAGGVLVGGLLLGPAGAIIGGLSGKQVSNSVNVASRIELRLTVNDLERPLWVVTFLSIPTLKGSPDHRHQRDQALQWQALLAVLIRQADAELVAPVPQPALPAPGAAPEVNVCRGGQDIGTMPVARVRALLDAGKLSATEDFYFDPQLDEWTPLHLLPVPVERA